MLQNPNTIQPVENMSDVFQSAVFGRIQGLIANAIRS